MKCPCGLTESYEACCGTRHKLLDAKTPEALMRSRYAAYVLGNVDYIERTMCGEAAEGFDKAAAATWTQSVVWLELEVKEAVFGEEADTGYVMFIARFLQENKVQAMQERSKFKRIDGQWFYVDGKESKQFNREKVERNAYCPCGSLKKFKHCHG